MKQFPNQFPIEIPEVPEGWKPIAFRLPLEGEDYLATDGELIQNAVGRKSGPRLIVEKIPPRRIVLEDVGEAIPEYGDFVLEKNGAFYRWDTANQGSYKRHVFKVIEEDTGE